MIMDFKQLFLLLLTLLLSQYTWAAEPCDAGTYTLKHNEWVQISLPCTPPENNATVAGDEGDSGIFGDDIPGVFGADWKVYYYDPSINNYVEVDKPYRELKRKKAYWIVQITGEPGSSVELDMPEGSMDRVMDESVNCVAASGVLCFDIGLETDSGTHRWNMVGTPFDKTVGGKAFTYSVKDVLISANPLGGNVHACGPFVPGGCDLDKASSIDEPIAHNELFRYDAGTKSYEHVTVDGGILNPWEGFWMATLKGADGRSPKFRFKFELNSIGSQEE